MKNRKKYIQGIFNSLHTIKRKLMEDFTFVNADSLSPSQWVMLHIISLKEGMGVKQISRMLGITSSAVTQVVNGLVKKGYLKRIKDASDGRALQMHLTDKAKQQISVMNDEHIKRMGALFQVLDDDELSQYFVLNKKIAEHILHSNS